ncbi:thioredoxin-like domain-containing protein [Mucilaginibacter phyllosphaerae]|uniref:Redoxin domain-containing protein n=1 Tax=Mucilaginibacter phyllosphaerae TaxID=1812349 RepID=A0A4Y8AFA6_9SPHI|nr:thioredoxin-like domain-containing protein [Mucilaginibacter phyllosphaerae]MBB3968937.1 thiol-disulfide isomerase/thioredoxin [Mucilaginibacter phyllosphaerae]TEW67440.1 redoxin domain-containing protein [Mucilaginibacter phyllosphaerae]GGH23432.1 thiol:disulfide interchange protein [Mucilaginibacter phyllosphaerae]
MKVICIVLISCFGIACNAKTHENILIGRVKNYPAKKIYLMDAYLHDVKDSAYVKNGNFKFSIPVDKKYSSELSLSITKTYDYQKVLVFKNDILSVNKKLYGGTSFILDDDTVKITGDYNNLNHFLSIKAGNENKLIMRYQLNEFGYIQGLNADQRQQKIKEIKDVIQNNPHSSFLLSKLYLNKEKYSKTEIAALVSLFDNDLRKTIMGNKFQIYLDNRLDAGQKFFDLKLKDDKNNVRLVLDDKKLNMLIFWASWCGPCRMEIPQIKRLNTLYKNKGLNVVSISIDENQMEWYKALKQEQMKWDQFLVDKADIEVIEARYNFSSIPTTIFINGAGKEVYRISGYADNQFAAYKNVIDKLISDSE